MGHIIVKSAEDFMMLGPRWSIFLALSIYTCKLPVTTEREKMYCKPYQLEQTRIICLFKGLQFRLSYSEHVHSLCLPRLILRSQGQY